MNITVCLYIYIFFLSFLSFSSFHACNLRIKYFPVEEGWPKTPIQFLNNYNSLCCAHLLFYTYRAQIIIKAILWKGNHWICSTDLLWPMVSVATPLTIPAAISWLRAFGFSITAFLGSDEATYKCTDRFYIHYCYSKTDCIKSKVD